MPAAPAQIPACASTHWAPPSGSGVEALVGPGRRMRGWGTEPTRPLLISRRVGPLSPVMGDQARFPRRHLDRAWSLCLPTGPLISIPIRGERRFERQGADRTSATSTPTREGVGGGAAAATIEQQRPPACRPDFCSVAGPATTSGLLWNPAKPKEKRATMHKMPRAVLVVRGSGSAADFA